jgi:hypothetical protein
LTEKTEFKLSILVNQEYLPGAPFGGRAFSHFELDILTCIAKLGKPQTKYQIEKKTRINHASLHQAVEKLKEIKAIIGKEIGKTRANQSKTAYALTFYGVSVVIMNSNSTSFPNIVQNWGFVEPILIEKWNYFEKEFGREFADTFLKTMATVCVVFEDWTDEPPVEEFRTASISYLFEKIKDSLDASQTTIDKNKIGCFVQAIKKDKDLRKYAEQYIDNIFRKVNHELEWGNFLKGETCPSI